MAINRTPVLKRCRQLGLDPAVLGYSSKKESNRQPKRRRKESEYGMQLRAEAYERLMPATASAIASYLSSGAVKGVGPAIARRLVRAFGDDTLTVMEQNPAKLAEIQGISPKKAEQISNEYKKLFGIRSVMLNLEKLGIACAICYQNMEKNMGLRHRKSCRKNPYALCIEGDRRSV